MLVVFVVFLRIILLALFNLDELGRGLLDDRLSRYAPLGYLT